MRNELSAKYVVFEDPRQQILKTTWLSPTKPPEALSVRKRNIKILRLCLMKLVKNGHIRPSSFISWPSCIFVCLSAPVCPEEHTLLIFLLFAFAVLLQENIGHFFCENLPRITFFFKNILLKQTIHANKHSDTRSQFSPEPSWRQAKYSANTWNKSITHRQYGSALRHESWSPVTPSIATGQSTAKLYQASNLLQRVLQLCSTREGAGPSSSWTLQPLL